MLKMCTFLHNGEEKIGVVAAGEKIVDFNAASKASGDPPYQDLVAFFAAGGDTEKSAKALAEKFCNSEFAYKESDVTLLAPIPNPKKVLCLAVNYNTHKKEGEKETKVTTPTDIHVFVKTNRSIANPHDNLYFDERLAYLDYELELGIVIGKGGRYIPKENAMDHVAGYIVANDIGDRQYMPDMTKAPIHWFAMKAIDCSLPFGPYLLSKRDVKFEELRIRLWVNGQLRQDCWPAEDILWQPDAVISRISEMSTLDAGDVIVLGTPAGNGWTRRDFLKNGDLVEAELNLCGKIKNRIVMEKPEYRTV